MGLDTSHDCWHGPYSAFHQWRNQLFILTHKRDLSAMVGFGGEDEWKDLSPDPLYILLRHSDCDGIIEAKDCEPLANRLAEVLPVLQDEYDREKTEQFIEGLRLAARRGEDVGFH